MRIFLRLTGLPAESLAQDPWKWQQLTRECAGSAFAATAFYLWLGPNREFAVAELQRPGITLLRAGHQPPSRPRELHPEPLTEPCLSLSAHTARATPEAAAYHQNHRAHPVAR